MSKSFIIRNYRAVDRDQCRALWKELTEWHRQIYQDPSIGGARPEEYFDKHLAKVGPERLWVAVQDSQVVGLIGLIVNGEEAEMEPVIVNEQYRHQKIGKNLIREVLKEARRLRVRFLNVSPVARNVDAVRFFYGQGFNNVGHIGLFIDLSGRKWKKGPELFDCQFSF
jgi:ribosomal protein S18 acetylase RimI-like enzyme